MAFNWQTFKTRTLTAAVFVVVMLAGLLINRWTFFILFSIIHFGCWWEYLKLVEKIYKINIKGVTKFLLMDIGYIFFWLLAFKDHETPYRVINIASFSITIQWLLVLIIIIGLAVFLFSNKKISLNAKWMSIAGFIYISLSLGLMMDMSKTGLVFGNTTIILGFAFIPIFIIASIWINDTMAYIIGSLIGRTPLSKISPRKTWEGTVSGIILSTFITGFFVQFFLLNQSSLKGYHIEGHYWYYIAAIASIAGIFGDLLESKLKRMANVKDSGHIMPGHGGFLDRFDSMLLAIPAVWLFVYFFMR